MGLNLRGIQWPVHESQLQAIISALQSNEVAHLGIKAKGLDKKAFILKRSVFMDVRMNRLTESIMAFGLPCRRIRS